MASLSSSSSFTKKNKKKNNSKIVVPTTTPLISIPVPLVAVRSASPSSTTTTTPTTTIPRRTVSSPLSSERRRRQQQQQQVVSSPQTTTKATTIPKTPQQKVLVSPRWPQQQQQQQQQSSPQMVIPKKKTMNQSSTTKEKLWIQRGHNNNNNNNTATTTTTQDLFLYEEEEEERESVSISISYPNNETIMEERYQRFQEQAFESIKNIYEVDNLIRRVTNNGSLTTSLPEDCIALLHTLVSVLHEGFLILMNNTNNNNNNNTGKNYFQKGLLYVIQLLQITHQTNRTIFIINNNTIEDCCAAANDFLRLSELLEQFWEHQLLKQYPFLNDESSNNQCTNQQQQQQQHEQQQQQLSTIWNNVISILFQDAVVAAEYCQHYLMVYIVRKTSIGMDLFSTAWETEWTANEPITTLVTCIDEHLNQIEQYMCTNQYLYHKSIVATVKAIVCFYVRCLVIKADSIGRNERIRQRSMGLSLGINTTNNNNGMYNDVPFHNHQRALRRMRDDINILLNYFRTRVMQDTDTNIINCNTKKQQQYTNSALLRIITNEMWILETIHECLQTTAFIDEETNTNNNDNSSSSLESFIVVLHKRTGGNTMVTRFFMSDLWLLSNSQIHQRGIIRRTVNQLQNDLQLVTNNMMMLNNHQQLKSSTAGTTSESRSPNRRKNNTLSPLRQRPITTTTASSSTTPNDTMSLFIMVPQLDEMLRSLYEDRLAQGILPLCWMSCHPRGAVIIDAGNDDNNDNDNDNDDNSKDIDIILARKIQHFTNQIVHFPQHLMDLIPHHNNNKKKVTSATTK